MSRVCAHLYLNSLKADHRRKGDKNKNIEIEMYESAAATASRDSRRIKSLIIQLEKGNTKGNAQLLN